MTTTLPTSPTQTPITCGAQLYNIPTTDAGCAVPSKGNYTAVLSQCCHSAPVESYYNNCGLFCLAAGQSVGDLANCFTSNGVSYGDAFCNANMSATATGTLGQAKVSATVSGSLATSTGQKGEAGVGGLRGGSKMGWGVLVVWVVSAAVGALL